MEVDVFINKSTVLVTITLAVLMFMTEHDEEGEDSVIPDNMALSCQSDKVSIFMQFCLFALLQRMKRI